MTTTSTQPEKITGLGRDVLERRIAELEAAVAREMARANHADAKRAKAEEDYRTMFGTLTAAQAASTRDLGIARAVRAIGDDPIMQQLAPLGAAIARARRRHPAGCALRHLMSEVGEVADAMCIGDVGIGGDAGEKEDRTREELLDVATVAMRMYLGDRRVEPIELEVQRLTARVADMSNGLTLRGWWCLPCGAFNGEEHSKRTECRSCDRPKHARPAEGA